MSIVKVSRNTRNSFP